MTRFRQILQQLKGPSAANGITFQLAWPEHPLLPLEHHPSVTKPNPGLLCKVCLWSLGRLIPTLSWDSKNGVRLCQERIRFHQS
jgi:hypothetical protein